MSLPITTEEAAADWFALKRSGEITAQQLLEFQLWLDAAPENLAAYREMEESWAAAGALRDDPELLLLRGQARRAFPPIRRQAVAVGAVAAGLVAAAGAWLAITPPSRLPTPVAAVTAPRDQQTFHTGVGQRTTVTLADGS
ncbi:MAG TPA: DUF4880 domain-containing protein, partial [Caulobacteraceae bacterium]|nr:DUF4880 domain-containing protein [Caulobacteraceae bacterium]